MRQQAHFAILRLRLMKSGRQLAAQRALRASHVSAAAK